MEPESKTSVKKVYQYDLDYKFIKEWKSTKEIINNNPEYKREPISCNVNGRGKSAYGFIWSYNANLTKPVVIKEGKPVYQYDLDYNFIKAWKDIDEIIKANIAYKKSAIFNNLNCHSKSSYAYVWSYNKNLVKPTVNKAIVKVYQYNREYDLIKEWDSLDDILKNKPTYSKYRILENLNGKYKSSYNSIWSYNVIEKPLIIKKERKSVYEYDNEGNFIKEKIIYQYDLEGNFIKEWKSVDEILKANPAYAKSNITTCLYESSNSAYAYFWLFDKNRLKQLIERPIYQYDIEGNLIKKSGIIVTNS